MVTAGYASLSFAFVIVIVNVFVVLSRGSTIDSLKAYAVNMDDEQKKSHISLSINARPFGACKMILDFFCLVAALVQL